MRGKLWFALGAAAGFVLGARAGRDKYDEIVVNARKVWDHPTVQEAAGVVQAQANRLYHEGKDTVSDKLSHSKFAETRVGERLLGSGSGASAPGTTSTGSLGADSTLALAPVNSTSFSRTPR